MNKGTRLPRKEDNKSGHSDPLHITPLVRAAGSAEALQNKNSTFSPASHIPRTLRIILSMATPSHHNMFSPSFDHAMSKKTYSTSNKKICSNLFFNTQIEFNPLFPPCISHRLLPILNRSLKAVSRSFSPAVLSSF